MSDRLLADIGGTHARLAWQAGPGAPLSHVATHACADHADLEAVLRHHLLVHALPAPIEAAVGIANPVTGDVVRMTNRDWSFSTEALRRSLGLTRLLVLNDFTALALALPTLTADERVQVGGADAVPGAAIALLGAGTGLGVSGLLAGDVPIEGEGGHVTLAGTDAGEDAAIDWLRQRFGHASAERALSGPGLVNLYHAVCHRQGVSAQGFDAAEITAQGADVQCQAAVDLFLALLGTVAGNLALSLGARGGVYLGGGIVPRLLERLVGSAFRVRFEAKGRFAAYLAAIPVFVIRSAESPALRGAARALDR